MTDNRTTELLPCPFCGGEAETFNPFNADGTWCVLCSECAAATGFEQTEAEAIAAWNSRAELGSEPPYDELLRCLENDWNIRASWDGLRKFWCIELTEEGVRMRDAELGSGTITVEQVSMYLKAMAYDLQTPNPFKTLDEKKAIIERYAHELVELGSGTCEQVLTDCDDGLIPPFTAHCSACEGEWGFTPKYCPECGAKVTGTRDERKTVER